MRTTETITTKREDYARATAAAEVHLATTRALAAGRPPRALAIGMARLLGLALVPVAVTAATSKRGNE